MKVTKRIKTKKIYVNPFYKEWSKCCEEIGRSISKCIAEFYKSPEIVEAFKKFMERKKGRKK